MASFDFDNAGDKDFKIKQLEEGITKAQSNIEIFSKEAQNQMVLKAQLEAELRELISKS